MRKKKLAIFTAAVGFFTLCNVFIYTRRLRADEMARFWNWSASSLYSSNSYNGNRVNNTVNANIGYVCHFVVNGSLNDMTDDGHPCANPNGEPTNSSNAVVVMESVTSPSIITTTTPQHNNNNIDSNYDDEHRHKSSSSTTTVQSKAYFVLHNRTYIVDLNGTEVFTELRDPARNRTLTLTFSQSLFVREDKQAGAVNQTTPASPPVESISAGNGSVVNKKNATSVGVANGLTPLNAHPFQYLINVKKLCSGRQTPLMLVILVATAVEHVAQRQAIRDTWGSFAKVLPEVTLAFVMGRPVNHQAQGVVMKEALVHADIIQEDFLDTYKNLTLKTVMLLKWAHTYCPEAKYIMKADDDMFVNVPNLLKYLKSLRQSKSQLFGRLVKGARPLRAKTSKYYVPVSEYKDKVYPDYLSGTSYVMSADVAPILYNISKTTPMFFFEDVFITGICAKKAGIVRRNHIGFVYYKRPVKGCSYLRVITGHNNTPNDLKKIWKDLQKKIVKC